MSDTPDAPPPAKPTAKARAPKPEAPRGDRLKAALKANMARRKAQARARSGADKKNE